MQPQKYTDIIKILSNLRLPLILGVVFIHSNILIHFTGNANEILGFEWFLKIWNQVLELCVPTFFLISGYLYFRNGFLTRLSFIEKFRRRINTLIVPYLLWNFIGFVLLMLKTTPQLSAMFPQYQHFFDYWPNIFIGFFALPDGLYPFDMPLWFLRNLIIINCLTPIISLIFKYARVWGLFLIGSLCVFDQLAAYGITASIWYFSIGATFALFCPDLDVIRRYRWAFVVLSFLFFALELKWADRYLDILTCTFGAVFIIIIAQKVFNNGRQIWHNAELIFFVYACHGLYCSVTTKIAYNALFPLTSVRAFAAYFLALILNLSITLLIYFISKKCFPKFTRILTGSR